MSEIEHFNRACDEIRPSIAKGERGLSTCAQLEFCCQSPITRGYFRLKRRRNDKKSFGKLRKSVNLKKNANVKQNWREFGWYGLAALDFDT